MQLLAAQVEVAVLEAHVLALVGLLVRNVEGRHFRGAFHDEFVGLDLDLARGQIGIDGLGRAEFHFARYGDDAFQMRLLDETEERTRRMDDDLRQAVMVAQVDEEDAAMVAQAVHPARKADGLAGVGGAQLVARMRTIGMHISKSPDNFLILYHIYLIVGGIILRPPGGSRSCLLSVWREMGDCLEVPWTGVQGRQEMLY